MIELPQFDRIEWPPERAVPDLGGPRKVDPCFGALGDDRIRQSLVAGRKWVGDRLNDQQ